jgi:hypothetical protein
MKRIALASLFIALGFGCKKKESTPETSTAGSSGSSGSAMTPPPPPKGSAGSGSGSAEAKPAETKPAVDPGELQTPESVLYDESRDAYVITNINGKPAEADGNGYITVVPADGSKPGEKWIAGGKDGVKLDAPKGSAIAGDTLYVADITVVRTFDAKTGKQKPDIKIPGSTFLNDVASDGAGGVFVSDTGMDASFKPTGTDAIWHISKDGKATALIKNKDLGGPNGVWAGDKGSVWVVTFRSGELYQVDAKGKKGKPEKLPKGQLDGLIAIDGGDLLVSSWEGKCVYRGKPGGEWKEVASGVESPADFGYDTKRKRIVIPGFTTNKLTIQQL